MKNYKTFIHPNGSRTWLSEIMYLHVVNIVFMVSCAHVFGNGCLELSSKF